MRGFIHKRIHTRTDGTKSVLFYAIVEMTKPADTKRIQDWGRGHRTRRAAQDDLLRRMRESGEERAFLSKMPLGTYLAEQWLPNLRDRIEPTTTAAYSRAVAHIVPMLGRVPLRDLRAAHLNQLYVELRQSGRRVRYGPQTGQRRPLAAATVRRVHAVVSKALNDAIDEGLLKSNPAQLAKPPKERPNLEIVVWSLDELRWFLYFTAEDRLAPIWHLASSTGMRRGEVVGLRWRDIDFEASTIVVRVTRTMARRTIIVKPPKSGKPRVINIDPITLEVLDRLRRSVPWAQPDDYVAVDPDGGPLHPDRISQLFRKRVRDSGLPMIRFHDLRHTHASLLIGAGVPVKVVTERLGHADPGFTMRVYQHVLPGMQAAAVEVFAKLMRDAGLKEAS